MKRIALIAFSLFSILTYAQEGELYDIVAEYDIYYNTEIPNVKSGKLIIKKNLSQSIFLFGENETKNKIHNDSEAIIIQEKSSERYNFFDFKLNKLLSKEIVNKKEYLTNEIVPTIKWTLDSIEKKIGDLQVKKASAVFRGRNYIAWYSEDYPINLGPWKFQGLPGLIIEIYDESNRYHWLMKSLVKKYNIEETQFIIKEENINEIDLKEYVKLRYETNSTLINESKLPRGTIVESKKPNRNGIELLYEWEQ